MAFILPTLIDAVGAALPMLESVGAALGIVGDAVAGGAETTAEAAEATAAASEIKVMVGAAAMASAGAFVAAKKALEAKKKVETAEKAAKMAAEAAEKATVAEAGAWKAVIQEAARLEVSTRSAENEAGKAASLGARIGGELVALIPKIETGLKVVIVGLRLNAKALLEPEKLLQKSGVPTVYRKVFAGLLMTLAAVGIQLTLIALDFMGLSGSVAGKKVAIEAKLIVRQLHKKVIKLTEHEDSPRMVQTNKETHEQLIQNMYQNLVSTKRGIEKLKHNLERLVKNVELKGGEAGDNHHVVDSDKKEMNNITDIIEEVDKLMKENVDNHHADSALGAAEGEAAAARWLEAALGAAEGEAAAAGAAAKAEAAAATAAEAAEAEAMAVKASEVAVKVAEAAAAAEAEAAEKAMLESKEGLEATVKAEAEAEQAAEKAAELGASLGARIGAAVGAMIEAVLKKALGLVKNLVAKMGELMLLKMEIDQIPEKYRKVLAGMMMNLAAGGIKLVLVTYNFVRLSGSEEGKKVAKAAKGIVDELHVKARILTQDSSSKVPIYKGTHKPMMEELRQKVYSDKQELEKMTNMLDDMNNLTKEHVKTPPMKRPRNM